MVYSNKLRALRDAKGLTNHELSDISGVPESTVGRLMNGQTDNPSLQNVYDIVRALGGSMDDVLCMDVSLSHPNDKTNSEALQALTEHYDKLEEGLAHLHHALAMKDKWITRMFAYCCVITLLFIATLIVWGLMQTT